MSAKPIHPPLEADGWPIVRGWRRLDALTEGVFDCPHSTPKLTDFGPLVARSQDIRTGVFRMEEAARVSEETYRERIARAEPRYGDLLYSREGTYFGIAAEVPRDRRVCLGQRMVLIRPKPDEVDFRFLCYWLNSPIMARHLEGFRDGSVAQRLNMPTIRALPVPDVPLPEQRRIASLLGALDDRIELNRRMNATLEEMARGLFRSWFVDFDPVHARAAGEAPAHMPPETAALFPDSFAEDGLPAGWGLGTVKSVLTLHYGKSLPKNKRSQGLVPVYGSGGVGGMHNAALVQGPALIVGRKGTVGSLHWCSGSCWPIDTTFFVESDWPLEYCLRLLETLPLSDMNTDAAVPGLNRDNVYRLEVVVPHQSTLAAWRRLAEPMRAKLDQIAMESRTLAELRDALLPRLMSGELRVAEAEDMTEALL